MIANTLETHLTQRAFRQVLNAFARPGTVGQVDAFPKSGEAPLLPPYFETALRLFVDQAVTFAVAGPDAENMSRWITMQTHAKQAGTAEADFVLVPSKNDEVQCEALLQAKEGMLVEPELGASVLLLCGAVSDAPTSGLHCLELEGPGIETAAKLYVNQVAWARARQQRGDEYPCGIEVLLVDEEGNVAALPRTTRIVSIDDIACDGRAE